MFNKRAEIALLTLAVIGIVSLLVGAGAIFFWQNGTPQDVYVTYNSHQSELVPQGVLSPSIIWNNITLFDSTIFNETSNVCTGYRYGMNITVYPCKASTFSGTNIEHLVDFRWHGNNTQNVSWIFVYDGEIESGSMDVWRNVSFSELQNVSTNAWVNNFSVTNVTAFVNLGLPVASQCQFGNANNTQMYNVTRLYQNGTAYTNTFCFTTATPNGPGRYLISGNYWQWSMQQVSGFRYEWRDITEMIDYMGYGLLNDTRSYYKVQNTVFQPGQNYLTKWRYTPQGNATRGKWHIFGYNPAQSIPQAIISDNYIYLDPSWNPGFSTGLSYYWGFNEPSGSIASDNVSSANFTLYGSVRTGSGCKFGNCLAPTGSSDNASIARWDIGNSGAFTWSAWVYMGGTAGAYNALLWNADNSGQPFSDGEFASIWTGSPNGFEQRMGNSNGPDGTTMNLLTGAYKHVVFKMNSGGPLEYWLNGTNVYNSSTFTFTNFANLRVNIGGDYLEGDGSLGSVIFDELAVWNRSLSTSEVLDLFNNGTGLFYTASIIPGVTVNQTSPATAFVTNVTNMTFNGTLLGIGGTTLQNATIRIYNSVSGALLYSNTQLLSGTQANVSWNRNMTEGEGAYQWDLSGRGNANELGYAGNRTFFIDFTPPVVTFNSPANNATYVTTSFPFNVTINVTSQDANPGSCWFTTSDSGTQIPYTCNATTNATFLTEGAKTIFASANDSLGATSTASRNITIYYYNYSHTESVDPVAEGGTSTFTLYVNMTNIPGATATFRYNNTNFAPSTQVNTQNSSTFTYVLNVPVGYGNSSGVTQYYNWTFNITGIASDITTNTQTQTVYSPGLSDCSAGGTQILNFTHRDEATKAIVNYSAGNNLQLDLTLRSLIDNSISFHYNSTETNSPDIVVCVSNGVLNSTSYKLDLTGSYAGTGYVQEFFYIDNGTINLATSPQRYNWFDLDTDDSTTFLFTFLDENGIEVPGVIVEVLRYYIGEGQFLEVERAKEDNNGETHMHLVEEDVIYKFNITQQGAFVFLSDQYNAKCLSSPCSITLSAEPEDDPFPTVYNNLPEGSYRITADKDTRQVTLFFNLNQTGTMNLTVWTNDNNEVEPTVSGSTTASSGQVTVTVPLQYGNATYSAVVYMNDDFVASRVVDLTEDANDYFGTLGLFLGALAVLCLALIGASHGEWVIVWTVLGMITVSILFLVDLEWYALLTFIAGASIFLIKLVSRRRVS